MSTTRSTPSHDSRPSRRQRRRRYVVHYIQMLIAMGVGMLALGPAWTFLLGALGWSQALDQPESMALLMATDMAIGMSAWMLYRGHRGRSLVEMSASMYLPFVVLFVPMWAGVVSAGEMFVWGHVLMLFTMAGAMAIRSHEYAH